MPSILTMTPDPDSSVGLVLPAAAGLIASTDTTLGAICRMTDSNRSPICWGVAKFVVTGAGAGRVWACMATGEFSIMLPAVPPANAKPPIRRDFQYGFITGVPSRVRMKVCGMPAGGTGTPNRRE